MPLGLFETFWFFELNKCQLWCFECFVSETLNCFFCRDLKANTDLSVCHGAVGSLTGRENIIKKALCWYQQSVQSKAPNFGERGSGARSWRGPAGAGEEGLILLQLQLERKDSSCSSSSIGFPLRECDLFPLVLTKTLLIWTSNVKELCKLHNFGPNFHWFTKEILFFPYFG